MSKMKEINIDVMSLNSKINEVKDDLVEFGAKYGLEELDDNFGDFHRKIWDEDLDDKFILKVETRRNQLEEPKEQIISAIAYEHIVLGISNFSGNKVEIFGEQTVKLKDGRIIEHYLCNVEGYASSSILLKENVDIK